MNVMNDFLKCNFFILFKWLIIADVQLIEEDSIILIQLIKEDSEDIKILKLKYFILFKWLIYTQEQNPEKVLKWVLRINTFIKI